MNKQDLITRNTGVKLYDLSDPSDMHRMNMNERYCIKAKKEPTFKLIAPFGHPLKYKADFYYFESENTPISEQILEEMGFEVYSNFNEMFFNVSKANLDQRSIFTIEYDYKYLYLNRQPLKNLNANQLHQLIELLS